MIKDKKKLKKLANVTNVLNKEFGIVEQFENGHLKIGTANFWATSEKWFDQKTGKKGKGIIAFIGYMKGE